MHRILPQSQQLSRRKIKKKFRKNFVSEAVEPIDGILVPDTNLSLPLWSATAKGCTYAWSALDEREGRGGEDSQIYELTRTHSIWPMSPREVKI